jgi:hypothetical protein
MVKFSPFAVPEHMGKGKNARLAGGEQFFRREFRGGTTSIKDCAEKKARAASTSLSRPMRKGRRSR